MSTSLVEQNRPTLNAFVIANVVLLYLVIVGFSPDTTLPAVIEAFFKSAAAMTLVGILTVLLGGLLSPLAKAQIVFLRWEEPLPGSRAFTAEILNDPRINRDVLEKKLGKFPTVAQKQNEEWYRLYKKHEDKPSVTQAQMSYLLTAEMVIIGLIALVIFGISTYFKPGIIEVPYYNYVLALLIVQLLLTWKAARTYGVSFVRNVLAEESAGA
jgi:hypothetical protein